MGAAKSFHTEFHLVDHFENFSKQYLNFESVLEFTSPNGIADIVLFDKVKDVETVNSLSTINPRWAYALYSLPLHEPFTIEDFSYQTRSSAKTTKEALYSYMASGFCVFDAPHKKWIKTKEPKLIAPQLYAVEAKLKDWKRALKQAYRYLDYACESWVLLDESHSRPAQQNLDQFKRYNIGLASISTDGNLNLIYRPKPQEPKSELAVWYANACLAQKLVFG